MTALMLGAKFSILVMRKPWIPMQKKTLHEYGLMDRVVAIRSVDTDPDLHSRTCGVSFGDAEAAAFPKLEKAARAQIDKDGADVIVMG